MPASDTIGHIGLMQNQIPHRHFGGAFSATTKFSEFSFGIGKLEEVDLQKPKLCELSFGRLCGARAQRLSA